MSDLDPSSSTDLADDRRGRDDPATLPIDTVADVGEAIQQNVSRVIVGNESVVDHVVATLLGGGHVLLEDVPGVGKTMLARSIARSVDCTFSRIQFTPDLLPTDVTGVNVFDDRSREFEFQPGPVFGNVVLGDEINRAPPKTQAALLEAMEEAQVTVDGETRDLPDPFVVIATQNAVEPTRNYELPLAELDRFAKKLHLGYPDPDDEVDLLGRTVGDHPIESLEPVVDRETLVRAREAVGTVTASEPVRSYATRLAGYTREHARIGVSPRGTIALLRLAQARAALEGRDYVVPDDLQVEVPVVFPHRIRTTDRERDAEEIVSEALEQVPVDDPTEADDDRSRR
ncbi:AAA family ATPase [Natrarchaeobaculum aegyptiacum]|uniref:ATPase n=1 Tax=Natrarchaeobaculum aegyptiacum TaxID=745377 RepID=A0A2Z2HSK2_9EURY|nr:MoxR family ATPase [Natrarchaeobaculum aegyptiacum]ARS89055.1 ATPase [Natrarchaeobaculum aegyptiacum]